MHTSPRARGRAAVSLQCFTLPEGGMLVPPEDLCWSGGSLMFRAANEKEIVIGRASTANYFVLKTI